jgi:hypothetical protein
MEIEVWDSSETVTLLGLGNSGTERVIWHPSDGRPEQRFEVVRNEDEPLADTIKKKLRHLMPGEASCLRPSGGAAARPAAWRPAGRPAKQAEQASRMKA